MEGLLRDLMGQQMGRPREERTFVNHINEGRVTASVRQRCKQWLMDTMASCPLVMFFGATKYWVRHMKYNGLPVRSLDKLRCVLEALELMCACGAAIADMDAMKQGQQCQDAVRRVVENAAVDYAVLVAGFVCLVRSKLKFKDVTAPSRDSLFLVIFMPAFDRLSTVQPLVREFNSEMGDAACK